MNPKIKELIKQSTIYDLEIYAHDSHMPAFYFDKEKFAMLIIRDVLSNVWDEVQYSTSREIDYSTAQDIANEIDEKLKKYYGIK